MQTTKGIDRDYDHNSHYMLEKLGFMEVAHKLGTKLNQILDSRYLFTNTYPCEF